MTDTFIGFGTLATVEVHQEIMSTYASEKVKLSEHSRLTAINISTSPLLWNPRLYFSKSLVIYPNTCMETTQP